MSAPNPAWLLEEFRAFERSLALRTAIEMDLFTRISAGADTVHRLARSSSGSERGLRALCDYLTVQGHLSKRGARYRLTLSSQLYLTRNSPAYLGSAVRFLAGDATVAAFCGLRQTVERGSASHPKLDWIEYARSVAPLAQPIAEFAARALKVKSAGPIQVLDIAAGHGFYGMAIAAQNRAAQIFALDSREVLKIAIENARQNGMAERYHPIPGDALETPLGGPYDLILVANFAHHLDAAANLRLFEKCRAALKPSGRIVVIDFIANPDRVSPYLDASFALTILATSARGSVYTWKEHSKMLRAAGFRQVRQLRQRGFGRSLITACR
jgi:2-polyprenyl-3-methyl-5-hydroxy-6-metoxy-1,4-benzoquinol methylase